MIDNWSDDYIRSLEARAEAAEARIAAALAAYDVEDAFRAPDAMYQALTGDAP